MKHLHSGKVRDLYELPGGALLMVARDTLSAFDFVLDSPIPDKGRILTQLSLWWFDQLSDVLPNHVIGTDLPPEAPAEWAGRAVVVERLDMVPVECVARGYLTGSGLADYQATGTVHGLPVPAGLTDGSRLPQPLFTPTTKAAVGDHDEPMTFAQVQTQLGAAEAARLREATLEVYRRGARIAAARGIIVADTKIEVGRRPDGTLVLADELLTPDSSRFWPAAEWSPGRPQRSYDKQFVRDWLVSPQSGWERAGGQPPPPLPAEIIERTRDRYVTAYERLTGKNFH